MSNASVAEAKVRACKTKSELDAYQAGAKARGYEDGELAAILDLRRKRGWV